MKSYMTCTARLLAFGRVASLATSALIVAPAWGIDPSEVIAESTRAKVTIADYEAEVDKLPPLARAEFAANYLRLTQFLDTLYTSRALAADARKAGLDRDPVIARQIAIQTDRMLAAARYVQIDAAAGALFDKSIDQYTARAREIYLTSRAKYTVPEQVRAAHILIKVKGGKADEARIRADEIRAKALAGANFADLAREYSDDPTAKSSGGELGFFEAKAVAPEFAEAAFAMTKKDEISAPVKTTFGYHIILYEDRRPAAVRPFDDVKPDIMADLRKRVMDEARATAVRDVFSDPTLKVDKELIDRIYTEGAVATEAVHAPLNKP
jgi:peptidyl-prolyl cis-trans isomerase C